MAQMRTWQTETQQRTTTILMHLCDKDEKEQRIFHFQGGPHSIRSLQAPMQASSQIHQHRLQENRILILPLFLSFLANAKILSFAGADTDLSSCQSRCCNSASVSGSSRNARIYTDAITLEKPTSAFQIFVSESESTGHGAQAVFKFSSPVRVPAFAVTEIRIECSVDRSSPGRKL